MIDSIQQRVLVTGANGFVGREVLLRGQMLEGVTMIGLSRASSSVSTSGIYLSADITDPNALAAAIAESSPDVLIHSAGLAHQFGPTPADEFRRINAEGTVNVCRAATSAGVRRIVLISSVAVYGDYGAEFVDESFECRPRGAYAESKLEAEVAAQKICSGSKTEVIVVRLATVVGPGDRGNTARLVDAIRRRRFLWIGDGKNLKTMIDCGDAADGILTAAFSERRLEHTVFNLCAKPVAMREIVHGIADACGVAILPVRVSPKLARSGSQFSGFFIGQSRAAALGNTIEKWLSDDRYSGDLFSKTFGWQPLVSVEESVRRQTATVVGVLKQGGNG